ncbi:sulfotransferase-like domain-containing protein [Puniceibacterium confluentis]|uniref:sulfotransferase-like domain-containing protein n=1 Tax=Puniceibacterium confluentis TaxID=1958944 RepID=UPI00356ACF78
MRIAMWSGPRNLSTALMYSFGNRADMFVVDEPFYGPYLRRTGLRHPMRDEIIESRPETADQVVDALLGPVPGGKPHAYHKHMSQHMIDGIPRDWIPQVTNVFLIRHPARVLASFSAKYEETTLADIGFVQQVELFDRLCQQGQTPIVVDSADIRANPEQMLRALCAAIDLPFDPAMLSWPAGGHPQDGVWAPVWYGSVHQSTGFAGPEGALPQVSGAMAEIVHQALPLYDHLAAHRLR